MLMPLTTDQFRKFNLSCLIITLNSFRLKANSLNDSSESVCVYDDLAPHKCRFCSAVKPLGFNLNTNVLNDLRAQSAGCDEFLQMEG